MRNTVISAGFAVSMLIDMAGWDARVIGTRWEEWPRYPQPDVYKYPQAWAETEKMSYVSEPEVQEGVRERYKPDPMRS